MIGGRLGGGGRPGIGVGSASVETSDISTNSRSRILLTTFGGSAAVGLNGPGPDKGWAEWVE